MPVIQVQILEGRTAEQKRAFVKAVTDATVASLGCKPESVHVIIQDVRKDDWATGGRLWSDAG